jgi:hypothetical protein
MASPWIHRKDSLALTQLQVFAGGIAANANLYGLTPADAHAIGQAVDRFAAAYAVVMCPDTKTKPSVRNKNQARYGAEQIVRQYAGMIRQNAGISDGDKIAIGVRPRNPSRSRVHVPQSSPLLWIIGAKPGRHELRYSDTNTPDGTAKPFGAAMIQIYVAIADDKVDDVRQAADYGDATRNPVIVQLDSADDGKMATYFARWKSSRGETGPWSLPVAMRVAA